MSQIRFSSSSSSSNPKPKGVVLPPSVRNLYEHTSNFDRTNQSWTKQSSEDIDIKLSKARSMRAFAHTSIDYSVILMGSICLNIKNVNTKTIITDLYNRRITKVQHGAFACTPLEWVSRSAEENNINEMQVSNEVKVAQQLEMFFNRRPNAREEVRLQWMKIVSYDPHTLTGKFLVVHLLKECEFLIKKYIKHGPSLGLSVEEYVDLTSALFNHCNPVESLGNIEQEHSYALSNSFTKQSLGSKLISPVDPDQPIPRQVICQCNGNHVCIMT